MSVDPLEVADAMKTLNTLSDSRNYRVALSKIGGRIVAKGHKPSWLMAIWHWFHSRQEKRLAEELGQKLVTVLTDEDVDYSVKHRVATVMHELEWHYGGVAGHLKNKVCELLPVKETRGRNVGQQYRDRLDEVEARAATRGGGAGNHFLKFEISTDPQARIERINQLIGAFRVIESRTGVGATSVEDQRVLCELYGYLTWYPNAIPSTLPYTDFERVFSSIGNSEFAKQAQRAFLFALREQGELAQFLETGSDRSEEYLKSYLGFVGDRVGVNNAREPGWRVNVDDVRVLSFIRGYSPKYWARNDPRENNAKKAGSLLGQITRDAMPSETPLHDFAAAFKCAEGVDIEALAAKPAADLTPEEQNIIVRAREIVSNAEQKTNVDLEVILLEDAEFQGRRFMRGRDVTEGIEALRKAQRLIQAHPDVGTVSSKWVTALPIRNSYTDDVIKQIVSDTLNQIAGWLRSPEISHPHGAMKVALLTLRVWGAHDEATQRTATDLADLMRRQRCSSRVEGNEWEFVENLLATPAKFAEVKSNVYLQETCRAMVSKMVGHCWALDSKYVLDPDFVDVRFLKQMGSHFPPPHPIGVLAAEGMRRVEAMATSPDSPFRRYVHAEQHTEQYKKVIGELIPDPQTSKTAPKEVAPIKIITAVKMHEALGGAEQGHALLDREVASRLQDGRTDAAMAILKAMPKKMRDWVLLQEPVLPETNKALKMHMQGLVEANKLKEVVELYDAIPLKGKFANSLFNWKEFGEAVRKQYDTISEDRGITEAMRFYGSIPLSARTCITQAKVLVCDPEVTAASFLTASDDLIKAGKWQELEDLIKSVVPEIRLYWDEGHLVYFNPQRLESLFLEAAEKGPDSLKELFASLPESFLVELRAQKLYPFGASVAETLNAIFADMVARGKVADALTLYQALPSAVLKMFVAQKLSIFPRLSRQVAVELPPDMKRIYYVDVLKEQGRIGVNPKHVQTTLRELPGLPTDMPPRDLNDLPKTLAKFTGDADFQEALLRYMRGSPDFGSQDMPELTQYLEKLVAFANGNPDTPYSADRALLRDDAFLTNIKTMLSCVLQGLEDPRIPSTRKAQALVMLAEGGAHCAGGNINSTFNAYDLLYEPEIPVSDPVQRAQIASKRQLLRIMERNRLAAVDAMAGVEAANRNRDPVHTKFNIIKGLGKDFLGLRMADVLTYDDPYEHSGIRAEDWTGGIEGLMSDLYKSYDSDLIIREAVATAGDYDATGMLSERIPDRVVPGMPVVATSEFLSDKVIDGCIVTILGREAFKNMSAESQEIERKKVRRDAKNIDPSDEKAVDDYIATSLGKEKYKAMSPELQAAEREKIRRIVEADMAQVIDPEDREAYYSFFETQEIVRLNPGRGGGIVPTFKPRVEYTIELLEGEDYLSFS